MTKLDFAKYKVTAASIQWTQPDGEEHAEGKKFGCLGSIEVEPEVNTITIDCEGEEDDSVDVVRFLNVNISAHTSMDNRRKIYGLNSDGLKENYYGNDARNLQGEGIFTCELEDLLGRETLMMVFPRLKFTGGFKFSHENGGNEIAELTITAKAYAVNIGGKNRHYIEVEKSKMDEETQKNWHTAFKPSMVTAEETL